MYDSEIRIDLSTAGITVLELLGDTISRPLTSFRQRSTRPWWSALGS